MTTYYKFLMDDNRSPYRFFPWPLPVWDGLVWLPGAWVEVSGPLVACENGLHACRPQDIPWWMDRHCYALEYAEEPLVSAELLDETKVYGRRARLLRPLPSWDTDPVMWQLELDLLAFLPEAVQLAPPVQAGVLAAVAALRQSERHPGHVRAQQEAIWDASDGVRRAGIGVADDLLTELRSPYLRHSTRLKEIVGVFHYAARQGRPRISQEQLVERIGEIIVARIDPPIPAVPGQGA